MLETAVRLGAGGQSHVSAEEIQIGFHIRIVERIDDSDGNTCSAVGADDLVVP